MLSRTHVLLAEEFNGGITVGGSTSLAQPPNRVDWSSMYDELTWTLSLSAVSGAPSAWSLGAKFQYRQEHTGNFRFQEPRWFDLAAENIYSDVTEGVGWHGPAQAAPVDGGFGIIATQASSLSSPIVVKRTLRNFPRGVRVVLDLSFTGGTSPKAMVGLEVTGRGR